jgi:hypothetical protein
MSEEDHFNNEGEESKKYCKPEIKSSSLPGEGAL